MLGAEAKMLALLAQLSEGSAVVTYTVKLLERGASGHVERPNSAQVFAQVSAQIWASVSNSQRHPSRK